jgi:hypothetical protein
MNKIVHHIGLGVHKESIAVAIAPEKNSEVRKYGIIRGTSDALDKLTKKTLSAQYGTPLSGINRSRLLLRSQFATRTTFARHLIRSGLGKPIEAGVPALQTTNGKEIFPLILLLSLYSVSLFRPTPVQTSPTSSGCIRRCESLPCPSDTLNRYFAAAPQAKLNDR